MCGGVKGNPLFFVAMAMAASVSLWEDRSLAGFMPLKAISVQPTLVSGNDNQKVC